MDFSPVMTRFSYLDGLPVWRAGSCGRFLGCLLLYDTLIWYGRLYTVGRTICDGVALCVRFVFDMRVTPLYDALSPVG